MNHNDERFVVVRGDNNYYIRALDQSEWVRHIANAKIFTEKEAMDKVEEIEASDFEYRVYISPLRKEREWYSENYE